MDGPNSDTVGAANTTYVPQAQYGGNGTTKNAVWCSATVVSPVDCFHEGPNFLVIDPDECIDCTLCEPECPVGAIYPEEDVPAGQEVFVALNAELAKQWPVLATRKDALPDAAEWDGKPGKLPLLER